jgi:glutathione synthase/RimK-type ligase-like ATP-grasp enzyme
LARCDIPTVPTTFLAGVDDVDRFERGGGFSGNLVVKPSVGASASGVVLTRDDPPAAAVHARALLRAGLTPMVQTYLADIESSGETALVYLGGRFSHGVRRRVVLPPEGVDVGVLGDERSEARIPTTAERALGDSVVAHIPETAYARIDLLPTPDGPVVLEVEVTEPSLFLHLDDEAPARAAAAFRSL